jgi:hypothetical protein
MRALLHSCYSDVSRPVITEREQVLGQIDHLVNSHALHGSESLCKLLRYLAKHALDHPGVSIKEFQIATEVFGRSGDFDPQLDSMVRVQAGRLRSKLAEYYVSDGANDPIAVDLPRGTYVLSFHHRAKGQAIAHNGASAANAMVEVWPISKKNAIFLLAASILLSATLAVIATVGTIRKPFDSPTARADQSPDPALEIFWKPFLNGANEPWIVFSNGSFIGRPETGLRYYDPAKDSGSRVWDHYTGVGEVLAVHNLDQVFGSLHRSIQVKRGSLMELDDVKNNDLIFIGSPSENLTLMDIPGTKELVFQRLASGPRKGDLAIENLHPEVGEPAINLASPSNSPLTEDYAIVALLPGLNSSHSIMILAGTTTFGTQGAVEYVCRQNLVTQLLQRLSVSKKSDLKPFEALLRVKIARGVPVQTELAALRKRVSQ